MSGNKYEDKEKIPRRRKRRKEKEEDKASVERSSRNNGAVKSKFKAEGIRLNDLVMLHSPIRHGWVRYIGKLENLRSDMSWHDGDFYGIELKAKYRGLGRHNGTFRGVKYFTSAEKCGVFCKRDKIEKILKRAALLDLENALQKLSTTKETQEKVILFADTVRRLTAILSITNGDGLAETFEAARRKSRFTFEKSPFLSMSNIHDCEKGDGAQKGQQDDGDGSHTSHSSWSEYEDENFPTSVGAVGAADADKELEDLAGETTKKPAKMDIEVIEEGKAHRSNSDILTKPLNTNLEAIDEKTSVGKVTTSPLPQTESEFLRLSVRRKTLRTILDEVQPTTPSEELKQELEEDWSLFAVAQETREKLNSKQDVKELLANLQLCIQMLKKHIPRVARTLDMNDEENTIFMTHVIQDLLKRAQMAKLSPKIKTDFTGIKELDYSKMDGVDETDVSALVETMAWVRNNLCIAGLTDENDAMMTLMGAEEVQESLLTMMKKIDEKEKKKLEGQSNQSPEEEKTDELALILPEAKNQLSLD